MELSTFGDNVGATFTGFSKDGDDLFESLADVLRTGSDPESALMMAVGSAGIRRGFGVLVAFNTPNGEAHLVSYASDEGQVRVVEDGDPPVVFPSDLVEDGMAFPVHDFEPSAEFMASLIAYLQTNAAHHRLIDELIGGVFSGVYWDGRHRHWQPDMLFTTITDDSRGEPYGSIVREGVWIVGSNFTHSTRHHPRPLPRERVRRRGRFFFNYLDFARFDYLALIDPANCRTVVTHMHKHRLGARAWFEIDGPKGRIGLSQIVIDELYPRRIPGAARIAVFRLGSEEDGEHPVFKNPPVDLAHLITDVDHQIDRLYSQLPADDARIAIDELIRSSPDEMALRMPLDTSDHGPDFDQ